jgi:nicotinamide N-methyltransferase
MWLQSLCQYIVENPQLVKGKRVLELGAGGALPSIVCALEGAKTVVITDYPDEVLLENIRWNASQAGLEVGEPDGLPEGQGSGAQVTVAGHLWGKDVTPLLKPVSTTTDRRFDLLILSDLIFNHSQHAALLSTCERAISEHGVALVFHSHHLPQYADRDLGFFRMAKERGWEIEQVVEETKYGVMFEEDKGDERLRGTVWGWAMRRRDSVDGSQL